MGKSEIGKRWSSEEAEKVVGSILKTVIVLSVSCGVIMAAAGIYFNAIARSEENPPLLVLNEMSENNVYLYNII